MVSEGKTRFEEGSPYKEKDWDFYKDLISGRVETNVIKPRAGDEGRSGTVMDDQVMEMVITSILLPKRQAYKPSERLR